MILPQPLLRTWEKRCSRRLPVRSLTIKKKGVDFGVTRLAKFEGDALVFDKAQLLALLSVASGYLVPETCLDNIRRAEKRYKHREIALAQMEVCWYYQV